MSPSAEITALLRRYLPEEEMVHDGIWLRMCMQHLNHAQRAGWKLHLSATPSNYLAMLSAALPTLARAHVAFKVLGDLEAVEHMNAGDYGLTQVGKCATIYPRSEDEAREIAVVLRTELHGLKDGPAVPTDYPFCSDAPIYFRFGPFDGRTVIDAMGQERRLVWREDLGVDVWDASTGGPLEGPAPRVLPKAQLPDHLSFLRADYAFESMLQLTAKGTVLRATNLRTGEAVVIKTARRGTNSDRHGRDAIWALRREHALLESLAGTPGVPAAGALIEHEGVAAIIRPFVAGHTFWDHWTLPGARTPIVRQALARAIDQAADTLTCIHARGWVVRDLSAGNLVLAAERVYLTDLELAHAVDDPAPPYRRGTRGFFDPAVPREAPPQPAADHHALRVLSGMIASEPVPPCAAHLPASLETMPPDDHACRSWFQHALAAPERGSARNEAAHAYGGVAGLVLSADSLGMLDTALADLEHAAHAVVLAVPDLRHVPGLHFGASGLALALGVLARHGAAPQEAALRVLLAVDPAQSVVPDLCQGLAGHLRAALAIHGLTGEPAALARAQATGKQLCGMAASSGDGLVWPWPTGPYGDLSGAACYGLAHGVAGVVDALVGLHALAPTAALEAAIRGGLQTLCAAAQPVPHVDDAVWWPVSAKDHACWNAWCHGTPGILLALSRLATRGDFPVPSGLLQAALRGMHLANNGELCLCHGVASRVVAHRTAVLGGVAADPSDAQAHQHDCTLLARAWHAARAGRDTTLFGDAYARHEGSPTGGVWTGATGALVALRYGSTVAGREEFLLI